MKEVRKNKRIKILALLIYVLILSCLIISFTIARYQSEVRRNAQIMTADWIFKLSYNNQAISQNFLINLTDTIDENSQNVTQGYIAPGTKGTIPLKIDCIGCEVGVEYKIIITDQNSTIPNQLKFYTNSNFSSDSQIFLNTEYKKYLNLAELNSIQTENIYWKWIAEDTSITNANDIASSGRAMTVNLQVTGTQMLTAKATEDKYFNITQEGIITLKPEQINNFKAEVTDLAIPNEINGIDVNKIGDYAFFGITTIESVTFGNSLTIIGENAFENCSSLETVIISNNIRNINDNAFINCVELSNLNIESGVEIIGRWAFMNCQNLTSVIIPNSVTTIGESAFYNCNKITNVTISNQITLINKWTFWNCARLTNITIPNSVTKINEGAFGKCSTISSLTIGTRVTQICDSAFYKCTSITSLIIPNNVLLIENYAFEDCSSLISTNIPVETTVEENAFYGCDNL